SAIINWVWMAFWISFWPEVAREHIRKKLKRDTADLFIGLIVCSNLSKFPATMERISSKKFKLGKPLTNMKKPLLLLLVLLPVLCKGQQNIRGQVTDAQTREPLTGATVFLGLEKNASAVFTDDNGNFVFPQIPAGRH